MARVENKPRGYHRFANDFDATLRGHLFSRSSSDLISILSPSMAEDYKDIRKRGQKFILTFV